MGCGMRSIRGCGRNACDMLILLAKLDFGPSWPSRWGTFAFVYRHRALAVGSPTEVFACRLAHPRCAKPDGQVFSQALRPWARRDRVKVEPRACGHEVV